MKKTVFTILFLSISIFIVLSQSEIIRYSIKWQGIQSWRAGNSVRNVLCFEDATYPDETYIPYFNKRLPAENDKSYQVVVEDPVYAPVPESELLLVTDFMQLGAEPTVTTDLLSVKGSRILDIKVFPFVVKDGKVLKLQSFTLAVNSQQKSKKAPAATIHSYVEKSVLAEGKFTKIRVVNSGIYKLTYEDINSMGINPANVRIYGYGGGVLDQSFSNPKKDDLPELAIYMNKGSDGVFNSGDYILFYAQGINKWTYDKSKAMYTHVVNHYSSYGYYFVGSGNGEGKRIQATTVTPPEDATVFPVEDFVDYQVYEKELQSLANSGKEFYGETYNETTTKNFSFSFPNIVTTTTSLKTRLDVAAASSIPSVFSLSLNGSQTKNLSVAKRNDGDYYEKAKSANGVFSYTPAGESVVLNLTFTKSTSSSVGMLNYIELNARRHLTMSGSAMQFQNPDYVETGSYSQYKISNGNDNVQVWDITDQQNIARYNTTTESGKLTFYAPNIELKYFLAIDPTAASAFAKPEVVGTVDNQNLHGLPLVDMVIITHPNFLKQAEKLAQAHRELDFLTVAVVTTDQVYNEFSSGAPDATAYRWIMKMLYDRALEQNNTTDMPKYLLLMGRGTFDNRKLLPNSGDNLILTYQADNSLVETSSYVTDDYFAFLDDNEGSQVPSNLMDVGVGRIPVATADQATDVVDKTILYIKNQKKGIWKNQLCFLADDGDAALHMKQSDSIASNVARTFKDYQVNKIYLDSYNQEISASGETYPVARTQFHNLLHSGLFLLDYTGHAGSTGWTNELILTAGDVKNMSNTALPLWIGATCDFLQFDLQTVSGGEQVLLNPVGGGIGIISAARPVYASQNMTLNKQICDNLFKKKNGEHYRIGDVISMAKNNVGTEINKLSYVYMGDPAVKLNYPTKYKVKTSQINGNTDFGADTLRALSVVTVKGFISDESDNLVSGFNGELNVMVYDKAQRITTLNNHSDGTLTYTDRPNVLFSGKADVVNGEFTFTFMLPKDIKYNYGGGRINYYAYDKSNNYDEAQGSFENFIVGGTNTNVQYEQNGPEVKMYLNNSSFVSGDKVNETPLFMAYVSDENGINRVGSGIGHDLLLTVDNDPSQSYIVNDYFDAVSNSYTAGSIKYRLPEMKNGKHTLSFRVWDLLNNSTTTTTEFEVVKGMTPVILGISNYPNPVRNNTRIVVNYDRPETVLKTTIEIFDLSGRKIWYFQQSNADNVVWDLSTLDGKKAKSGIYLYRVTISTDEEQVYSKMNKMMVIEQ